MSVANERKPTYRQLLAEVAASHQTTVADILSRSRFKEHVRARHELAWLLRHELRWSFPKIGRRIGRDHSSVIYGVRAHEAKVIAGGEVSA